MHGFPNVLMKCSLTFDSFLRFFMSLMIVHAFMIDRTNRRAAIRCFIFRLASLCIVCSFQPGEHDTVGC